MERTEVNFELDPNEIKEPDNEGSAPADTNDNSDTEEATGDAA